MFIDSKFLYLQEFLMEIEYLTFLNGPQMFNAPLYQGHFDL